MKIDSRRALRRAAAQGPRTLQSARKAPRSGPVERLAYGIVFDATFERVLSTPCAFNADTAKYHVAGDNCSTTNDDNPELLTVIEFDKLDCDVPQ